VLPGQLVCQHVDTLLPPYLPSAETDPAKRPKVSGSFVVYRPFMARNFWTFFFGKYHQTVTSYHHHHHHQHLFARKWHL